MDTDSRRHLPDFDGLTAFGGGLRSIPGDPAEWAQQWLPAFGELKPELTFFATDPPRPGRVRLQSYR